MSANHRLILSNFRTSRQRLLTHIQQAKQSDPFAQVTILLPNTSAVMNFRAELYNTIGINLYQFYTLAQAILQGAQPIRSSASVIPLFAS